MHRVRELGAIDGLDCLTAGRQASTACAGKPRDSAAGFGTVSRNSLRDRPSSKRRHRTSREETTADESLQVLRLRSVEPEPPHLGQPCAESGA
jgi:hypothetical protein